MVVFDATMMLLFVHPDVNVPPDPYTKAKTHKHEVLQGGCRSLKKYEQSYIDQSIKYDCVEIPRFISDKLTPDNKIKGHRPNYFWYVCPSELIKEVPEYAGLIYCDHYIKIIKQAPRLHKEKISSEMEKKILSSFYYRYWKLRLEGKAA